MLVILPRALPFLDLSRHPSPRRVLKNFCQQLGEEDLGKQVFHTVVFAAAFPTMTTAFLFRFVGMLVYGVAIGNSFGGVLASSIGAVGSSIVLGFVVVGLAVNTIADSLFIQHMSHSAPDPSETDKALVVLEENIYGVGGGSLGLEFKDWLLWTLGLVGIGIHLWGFFCYVAAAARR